MANLVSYFFHRNTNQENIRNLGKYQDEFPCPAKNHQPQASDEHARLIFDAGKTIRSAAELARTSEWAREGKRLLTTDKAERNIEANIPITGSTIGKDYPDYNAEMVTIKGHDKARLAVLIRKGINYTKLQIHTPSFNLPPMQFTNSPTNIS